MKQVIQSHESRGATLLDVPAPALPEPGGVLVRTTASLVSAGTERAAVELSRGSVIAKARARPDLVAKVLRKLSQDGVASTAQAIFAKLEVPNPLGYSCAGLILDADDAPYAPAQRVACAGARIANHAEINAVPRNLCARVPDGLSDEEASFATVGAIALHGVRTARIQLGERVAVIGLGLVGQLVMQLVRAQGGRVLGIDLDQTRLDMARTLGCDDVCEPGPRATAAMSALSEGIGADAVIICAATHSDEPVALAGELARDRARVVLVGAVGMHLPRTPYYEKELQFLVSRSYGPGRYDPQYEERGVDYPVGYVRWTEQRNLEAFLEMVGRGHVNVKRLITHRFPIGQAEAAYRVICGESKEPYLGVVLTYPEDSARAKASTVEVTTQPTSPVRGSVGLAFVGAGAFASGVLVPAFAKARRARLVSVGSARGVSARHVADRHRFARATTSLDEQLRDPQVDAVVIATRHHLHVRQAVAAMQAGKHVFLEKPMALDEASLDELLRVRQQTGRLLTVGFNRRFAPLARELRQSLALRHTPLTIQYRVNAGPLPAGSWINDPEVGGGRIVGEACHMVDLCGYLAGARPVRVFAERAGSSGEDVVITVRYADGSVATIAYASTGDPAWPKERLEVMGGGLVAVLEDFRSLEVSQGGRRERSAPMFQDKGHANEAEAFVMAVQSGGAPPIPYDELAATTRATFAAVASLASGGPVDITG